MEPHVETEEEAERRHAGALMDNIWRVIGPVVHGLVLAGLIGSITMLLQMEKRLIRVEERMVTKTDLYTISNAVNLHSEKLSQIDKEIGDRTADRYRGIDAARDKEIFQLKLDALGARVSSIEDLIGQISDKQR